jgi:parallel beta-helix repeat protein
MSEIDRSMKGTGNNFRGRLLVTLIASAIVVSLMMTMLITPAHSEDSPAAPNVPARITYTVHDPILINDSADFASQAANESWPGNGSSGNPYIIQGYDINAASADGISIQNTNVHFIVRDCYVHDGHSGWHAGTYLFNCVNGTLINNTCSNDYGMGLELSSNITLTGNNCSNNGYTGIWLYSSDSNTLSNNNCSNNDKGIEVSDSCDKNTLNNNTCSSNSNYGIYFIASCTNNTISNNTCRSNSAFGICLSSSNSNNIVSNNNCSNNHDGIFLASSSSNIVSNNNCSSNTQHGISISLSINNTLINNNCSNNVFYGIAITSSSSNTISDNTCSDNQIGMFLNPSNSNNIISNNTCSDNQYGIAITSSSSNTLTWNQICNNTLQGVYIASGSNNRIWNNTFIGNNGAGAVRDAAHIQANDGGANNWWNTSGSPHGSGNYWSDWTTPDDNFDGIVDKTYNLTAGVGPMDYYPLTTPALPIPEFSEIVIPIVGLMLIALTVGRTRKKP